jgi:hypothetical protein
MYETAPLQQQMNDSEWQELLSNRPNLAEALTARTRSLRAIGHSDRCANKGAPTGCRPCGAGQHHTRQVPVVHGPGDGAVRPGMRFISKN